MRYYENVEIAQSTKIQFIDKGGNYEKSIFIVPYVNNSLFYYHRL